jgi:hypothetical protein
VDCYVGASLAAIPSCTPIPKVTCTWFHICVLGVALELSDCLLCWFLINSVLADRVGLVWWGRVHPCVIQQSGWQCCAVAGGGGLCLVGVRNGCPAAASLSFWCS